MNLEVGDLIFYKSNTLLGYAISIMTKSEYCHVTLYIGNNQIIEANGFIKSRITDLPQDKSNLKFMRYCIPLTDLQKEAIVNNSHKLVGLEYDYKSVVKLFLKLAFNINFKNKVNDIHTMFCSKLADFEYSEIGIDLLPTEKGNIVTPAQLEQSLVLIELK